MQSKLLEFWIDVNLPPALAVWLQDEFKVNAKFFKELGLAAVSDFEVFKLASKRLNTIIITTKDYDFVLFGEELSAPPKILYLNTGNISNKELKKIVLNSFKNVIRIFSQTNQTIVEITK